MTARTLLTSFLAALLALVALLPPPTTQAAAPGKPLLLAKEGRALYTIALPREPSATDTFAASELAGYLKRVSGADFQVLKGDPAARAIVLSTAPASTALPEAGTAAEGYAITVEGERIRVTGGRGRSLLFGVYALLEGLGCRWLAPDFSFYGGSAELIPRRTEIRFDTAAAGKQSPVLKFRKLYVEEGHSHTAENLAQLVAWMPKLRFNTLVIPTDYQGRGSVKWDNWRKALTPELEKRDLIIEVGGHGYQNFLNAGMPGSRPGTTLFQDHPEWFGQDEQGRRRPEHGRVFCTSNAAARRYLTANVLRYVKERPEIRIFDLWPPDGARWCECGACRAIGDAPERHAALVNEVVAAQAPAGPASPRLECIAYHHLITPPQKVRLDPGVLVDFCPIAQSFWVQIDDPASTQNRQYAAALVDWRKRFTGDISVYSYYRKYAWKSLPVMIPHYMQRDLRWYARLPVQGVSSYAEPGDWAAYELNHYVLGHLAWNPDADVDRLVREFSRARYGAGEWAARHTFSVLEDAVRSVGSIPGTPLAGPDRIGAARAALAAAEVEVSSAQLSVGQGSEATPQAAALKRLGLALEYARRDVEIQQARADSLPVVQTRAKVTDLAGFLQSHAGDGVFLMHSRLQPQRLLQSYGLEPRRPPAAAAAN